MKNVYRTQLPRLFLDKGAAYMIFTRRPLFCMFLPSCSSAPSSELSTSHVGSDESCERCMWPHRRKQVRVL